MTFEANHADTTFGTVTKSRLLSLQMHRGLSVWYPLPTLPQGGGSINAAYRSRNEMHWTSCAEATSVDGEEVHEMDTVGLDNRGQDPIPDLNMQFEELLGTVWKSEANWRFDDLLDVATRQRKTDRLRGRRRWQP